jgi:hypothetical protein
MKLPNGCRDISLCRVGIDMERRSKLIGDLSHCGSAVIQVPDVAGGVVQLMNEVGLTIEDHDLTIYHTNVDINPSLRVIRRLVHLPRSTDRLYRSTSVGALAAVP